MLSWLTVLLLFCSLISLALFIFIIRFAVKTEMVITASIFTLLISIGLLSWAMQTTLVYEMDLLLWSEIGYLCAILMFPLLIFLFVHRAGSSSYLVTTAPGRVILFCPFVVQLLAHYLLPEDISRFSDFAFLLVWLAITLQVWKTLFAKMQQASSEIRKNQMEFMLASFFVVMIYNLNIIFNLFISYDAENFTFLYGIVVVGALIITIRGLVKYQLVIGTELLVRNSLILLLTAIICVASFVICQVIILSVIEPVVTEIQILVSTLLVIVLVLSINPISNMATHIVERISPQLKWQESNVREIFVLHSNGLVIAHAGSETKSSELDRDMVGGMLTAIQNFIQEAFHSSEMESLKSLNMGKLRMLIEAKGDIVVAVLFTGHEARELRRGVKHLIDDLDLRFGDNLHTWKGDKTSVSGVQQWIEHVLKSMGKGNA